MTDEVLSDTVRKALVSWRDDHDKFAARTMGGTAGPITGTLPPRARENFRLRFDVRDRDASNKPFSGSTTETHTTYQVGSGATEVECRAKANINSR